MLYRIIVLLLSLLTFCYAQQQYTLTQSDINSLLDYHNKLRAPYSTGSLTWDNNLATQAGTYAKGCVFQHSNPGNSNYGENLAVNGVSPQPGPTPFVPWKTQLDGWKAEESSWNCMTNGCPTGSQCGHLTAMIWNGTKTVGCGVARCDPGTIYTTFWSQYIVCQYAPPGNWDGVHPITAKAPPCNTCPTLPTASVIPSTGAAPTGSPVASPVAPPAAPLGSTKPKSPAPTPKSPAPTPKLPPPTFAPTAPGAPSWAKCIGDYWVDNVQKLTPCNSAPKTFTGKLYCDVKDPKGYYWPVQNAGSTDCYFFASLTDEADASRDGILSTPAWIGVAVGSAAFIIIVIIVVIIIKKRNEDKRV